MTHILYTKLIIKISCPFGVSTPRSLYIDYCFLALCGFPAAGMVQQEPMKLWVEVAGR